MLAPVAGLRPILAALWLTENVPKPTRETEPPPDNSPAIAEVVASIALPASAFESPVPAATALIRSPLFMMFILFRYKFYFLIHRYSEHINKSPCLTLLEYRHTSYISL
jgi:hypothetical protein